MPPCKFFQPVQISLTYPLEEFHPAKPPVLVVFFGKDADIDQHIDRRNEPPLLNLAIHRVINLGNHGLIVHGEIIS